MPPHPLQSLQTRRFLTHLHTSFPFPKPLQPVQQHQHPNMRDLESDISPVQRKPTEHVLPEQEPVDSMFVPQPHKNIVTVQRQHQSEQARPPEATSTDTLVKSDATVSTSSSSSSSS